MITQTGRQEIGTGKKGMKKAPEMKGDWVFRVCDFSLKPAKTCVFKLKLRKNNCGLKSLYLKVESQPLRGFLNVRSRDPVFRVSDVSLQPMKASVFKYKSLVFRKSPILQKLWVSWRVLRLICFGDLRHHCYTKLADGVPLSQTRSLRGHTSFGRLHRIATSEHCTGDWVFRVCDFSLKPAKTCVFKEIRFFGFLTFLCSLRRPLYLRKSPILQKLWVSWRVLRLICFGFLTRDLRHHCYTKLADGVPLSQTRSLRGHTSFGRLHRIATSEHCTGASWGCWSWEIKSGVTLCKRAIR
ncbi:uncharacterized protein LOC126622878 [Malus sylvestris]|uniref:uncharacterized protein LOC126622878 n=1 Tax=Malus sylvestris TaxID=3752 RepID=UPI0021ACB7C4|nr:uncharacterized protein LOC126622878 [Malus sylvestris]